MRRLDDPREEITDAVLYSVRHSLVIPGYVLKIETHEKTYHSGLSRGSFWSGDLPIPVRRERGRLAYSPFSVAVRLLGLGALAYLAWKHYWR